MSAAALALFKAFFNAIASEKENADDEFEAFQKAQEKKLKGFDPIAANDVVEAQLKSLNPDTELLDFYKEVRHFQIATRGDGYQIGVDNMYVPRMMVLAIKLSGQKQPKVAFMPTLIGLLKEAILDSAKIEMLTAYKKEHADILNDYRYKQLEARATNKESVSQNNEGEFTHAQQALAIEFLFYEGLGLRNVETTKFIGLAHLLAAKKIPINPQTGKERLSYSGIKSAFTKARNKKDKYQIADLIFILRFFKPLADAGVVEMQRAVEAIEKQLEKAHKSAARLKTEN